MEVCLSLVNSILTSVNSEFIGVSMCMRLWISSKVIGSWARVGTELHNHGHSIGIKTSNSLGNQHFTPPKKTSDRLQRLPTCHQNLYRLIPWFWQLYLESFTKVFEQLQRIKEKETQQPQTVNDRFTASFPYFVILRSSKAKYGSCKNTMLTTCNHKARTSDPM